MNQVAIILIVSAAALLVATMVFLVLTSKKKSSKKNNVSKNESQTPSAEINLSRAYTKKLEKELAKGFEQAARNAALNLQNELYSITQNLVEQNKSLTQNVKELENSFAWQFKESMDGIQEDFFKNINNTLNEVNTKNSELIATVENLESATEGKIREVLNKSINDIQAELSGVGQELKTEVKEATTNSVQQEIENFKNSIAEAQETTIVSLTQMYKDIEAEKKAMEEKAYKEVEDRRNKLLNSLDQKINEIVVGFLVENLGDALDLKQQQDYIFKMLEENKENLKQDIYDQKA